MNAPVQTVTESPPAVEDYITIYTADNTVNKICDDNNGNIIKREKCPTFYHGWAVKKHCPKMADVKAELEKISENPNQCFSLGYHPEIPVDHHYYIESRTNLKNRINNKELAPIDNMPGYYKDDNGTIVTTRTKDIMAQSPYILLDKDDDHPDKYNQKYDDWENDFDRIMPGFKNAEKIVKPSNSSRATGGDVNKFHVIIKIKSTNNVTSLGHRILSTANSLGLGFTKKTKDDKHLSKTITDINVLSAERLIYDGKPTVYNSAGKNVSDLKLSSANIQLLPGDGKNKPIDTSLVRMMSDDKAKFKAKFIDTVDFQGKTVKVKNTVYQHNNTTDMKLDDPITIKHFDDNGEYIQVTPRQLHDNPELFKQYDDDGTGKIRCQSTYDDRGSTSWNGLLRRAHNGIPILIDNGSGIRYELSDGDCASLVFTDTHSAIQPMQAGASPVPVTSTTPAEYQLWQPLESHEWHPLQTTSNGKKPKSTLYNFERMLNRYQISIGYDQISKKLIMNGSDMIHNSDKSDNANYSQIYNLCKLNDIDVGVIDQYLSSLMVKNEFNPVAEWIHSKPWDGIDRILELFNTLTLSPPEQDRDIAWMLFKKWLIGACRIVQRKDDIDGFEFVLVLQDSEGGKGKTRWIRKLGPKQFVKTGVIMDPSNKDIVKQAVSYWLVELGELDGTFRRSEIKSLMAFLDQSSDELRLPYAKTSYKYSRRTAFCATVNNDKFLIDDSGDRRFWPISIASVNYEHNIDMQQMWAQVDTLNEIHWLNDEENDLVINTNKKFKTIDPIDEMLQQYFSKEIPGSEYIHLNCTQILQQAGITLPN
ncbi:MAG: hypothetical protein IME94_07960 [Proteobacteria bacterium]|nr:hypothetical protein [Pseudomonadota bacterium]